MLNEMLLMAQEVMVEKFQFIEQSQGRISIHYTLLCRASNEFVEMVQ